MSLKLQIRGHHRLRSYYVFYTRPTIAFKYSSALFLHIKTQFSWSKFVKIESKTEGQIQAFSKKLVLITQTVRITCTSMYLGQPLLLITNIIYFFKKLF